MCIKLSILGVLFNKLKLIVLWIGLMSPNSLAKILMHFSTAQWFRVLVLDQNWNSANSSFQVPIISSKLLHLFVSEFPHLSNGDNCMTYIVRC